MTPEQKAQFEQLIKDVASLKEQQVTSPIDPTSHKVLFEDVPVMKTWTSGSAATNGYLTVRIRGKLYKIQTRA